MSSPGAALDLPLARAVEPSLDRAAVTRCELPAAFAHLAATLRARPPSPALALLRDPPPEPDAFDVWLSRAASLLDQEAIEADAAYPELDALLARCAPGLLNLDAATRERFLLVTRRGKGSLFAMDAAGVEHELPDALVRRALSRPLDAWIRGVESMLGEIGCDAGGARERAVDRLLRSEASSDLRVGQCWLLRSTSGDLRAQLSRAGVLSAGTAFLAARLAATAFTFLKWSILAAAVERDTLSGGDLVWWSLAFVSEAVFDVVSGSPRWDLATRLGLWLRRTVFRGALSLDIDDSRKQGAGSLLARAIDVDRLEAATLQGGLSAVVGAFELVAAFILLSGHPLLTAWLVLSVVVLAVVGVVYTRRTRAWTDTRLDVTGELVSSMVGHRTRLVHQRPERWHDREEVTLDAHAIELQRLDAVSTASSSIPSVFMLGGLALLIVTAVRTGAHAISEDLFLVAGLLVAFSSLSDLLGALRRIGAAIVAWEKIRPLVSLDARLDPRRGDAHLSLEGAAAPSALDLVDVVFRYAGRTAPALDGVSLRIEVGDRLLLEGPSGGGKSTFASLMAGLRLPERGVLLHGGTDRRSLPFAEWRRAVAYCPQFHENFLFSDTLAFNLLMSRRWPTSPRDLELAETLCRELGLGPLLDAMPLGLQEVVGESGWRLSHGERSRIFIARTLLRSASVSIFDESFAALDPETLLVVMRCVERRAGTLVIVAHP
ncbi:ATP-binding cassette domain-containing protein [Chondromyces apiculatus]|uniref:ABC transporter ATP-binding protein n=1 Tax=Chondromyces apiculatus DSM 436 TaxID=1192034 RepID=A0A017SYR6_9BACT|nr:ABC transporter ATP-binding protein [Chondromyces apiculatus]EYF01922.1 Hypothetical protein CAP_7690 [Chondromyces apiculatus DSM 436]